MKRPWKAQSPIKRQESVIINIVVSVEGWRQGTGRKPNSWKAGDLNTKKGNFLCSNSSWSGTLFGADLALKSSEGWHRSRKVFRGQVGHPAAKRHWRNTQPGSSLLWSNKGCSGRERFGFKASCVLGSSSRLLSLPLSSLGTQGIMGMLN